MNKSLRTFSKKIFCLGAAFFACTALLTLLTGCGAASTISNNTDITRFKATLCPGYITGSSGTKTYLLYASIENAYSVSAWITDKDGNQICNDGNFKQKPSAGNIYETITAAGNPGDYTLWYSNGTETASKTVNITWGAAMPEFNHVPSVYVDSSGNYVASNYTVTGGNATYYLRICSGYTGANSINNATVYAQEYDTTGLSLIVGKSISSMLSNTFALIVAKSFTGSEITSVALYTYPL